MQSSVGYLHLLTNRTKKPEAEVITMAFQIGLKQMWREHILGQFLRQEISRNEAIESVGIDWIELAERQYSAMKEDMEWALKQ